MGVIKTCVHLLIHVHPVVSDMDSAKYIDIPMVEIRLVHENSMYIYHMVKP